MLDYFVDRDLYMSDAMSQKFVVTARSGNEQLIAKELPIREFQTF